MTIPNHIAIIMDGNRRWAKEHSLPVIEGHRRVADRILEPLVEHAAKRGVTYITFWAWSTENWKRKEEEVSGIMSVFRHVIAKKWQKLHKRGVRIKIIGNMEAFEPDIRQALADVVEQTKNNTTITTIFALNYGGRDEIVRAINKTVHNRQANLQSLPRPASPEGGRQAGPISSLEFAHFLDTGDIPDPELIIRTGGEQRLSGFLLWQSEYSELYFPSWYMPEFTPEKFDEALEEYAKRKRNFGV